MTASHWNTDHRTSAWQTFSQPLPATAEDVRPTIMHTPSPSRCVLDYTDGRRVSRVHPNQFDTCAKALRREQLQVFRVEQSREHASSIRAELHDGFLPRRENPDPR